MNDNDLQSAVEDHVYTCWRNGLGIKATIFAIKRVCGVPLTFDQIHRRFVAFSRSEAA